MVQQVGGTSSNGRSAGELADQMAPVSVPTPSGGVVLVDPRVHREDVVRRLLGLGVSPRTLLTLLPGWEELIRAVVAGAAVTQAAVRPRP